MTRYPKQGKGKRWTIAELKAIPSSWRGDTLADGDGLSGEVRVGVNEVVAIRWKYAFRWETKVCWFQAGTWPATNLEEIRLRRDGARRLAKTGVNPNLQKQAERIETHRQNENTIREAAAAQAADATVQQMFEAWVKDGVRRKDGNVEIRRSFEKDFLSKVGSVAVRLLTDVHIRNALESIVADRGANKIAVNLCAEVKQMFRWAEKRQPWRKLLTEGNPAELVEIKNVVSQDYEVGFFRSRKLSIGEVQELAGIFADSTEMYERTPAGKKYSVARPVKTSTQIACWICLSTLTRIGETLLAEWNHVDLEKRIWHIPKDNVKGTKGKKFDLDIQLSDFALRQFNALRELTEHTRWCFPSGGTDNHIDLKSVTKQIGDRQERFKGRTVTFKNRRQDNSLVLDKGESGDWKPHDLRRTGATMMQKLQVPPDVIDRCQNHVLFGSKIRRTYLQHEYMDEMLAAWRVLGEYLDAAMVEASEQRKLHNRPPFPRHLLTNSSELDFREPTPSDMIEAAA